MQVYLTWPAVGKFTTPDWEGPAGDYMSRFTTLVVAFLSAVVGGNVSDLDAIWPIVSFDGENVGRAGLHPDST